MTNAPEKKALRRRLRTLRRQLAVAVPDAAGRAAAALPATSLPPGAVVGVYYAQGSELDPRPLAERLAALGAAIALPAANGCGGLLQFRRWAVGEPLQSDPAGVPAPLETAELVTPHWVVVPLLGFDRQGGRLGQGGGHYDRTLARLRATGRVFALGFAYADQEVDAIPMESHDQRLDAILTENGYIVVERGV